MYLLGGKKKKGSKKRSKLSAREVKQLLQKTRHKRNSWIRNDKPLVSDVTEKFPQLVKSRWASHFYLEIVL